MPLAEVQTVLITLAASQHPNSDFINLETRRKLVVLVGKLSSFLLLALHFCTMSGCGDRASQFVLVFLSTVKAPINARPKYCPPSMYIPRCSMSHCAWFVSLVIDIFEVTGHMDVC